MGDTLRVCDLVTATVDWDWGRLRTFLPENIVTIISAMVPPMSDAGEDRLAWKWSTNSLF